MSKNANDIDGGGNSVINVDLVDGRNVSLDGTNQDNHIANVANPHTITKAQVGLGNVDNTSDINKPITNATQNALDSIVFGTEFQILKEAAGASTNSNGWVRRIRMTTTSLIGGNYRIDWNYSFNRNNISNDFKSTVRLDNTGTVGTGGISLMHHQQELKDSAGTDGGLPDGTPTGSGSNQSQILSSWDVVSLTAGVHTIDIDYGGSQGGSSSTIWNIKISLWRID